MITSIQTSKNRVSNCRITLLSLKIYLNSKMETVLKRGGIIYASFKYGVFEGERNGRYFTDMTEVSFAELLAGVGGLRLEEQWTTSDVRPGRGEEKWLNIILRKL